MEVISGLHRINIILHVTGGSLALLVGLAALIVQKEKKIHRLLGRVFLWLMSVTILTGLIGVFVFGRNTFLLVITVLSGYLAFSGYRAIKQRSNKPQVLDITVSLISVLVVAYFLYYFSSIGMIWSPVIVFSTVGYLVLMVVYDLIRYFLSPKLYAKLWMHEHILKMVSAFSGLLSAFSGTVFPQHQPYSQFLPSVLGTFVAISFMVAFKFKAIKTLSSTE